MSANHERVENLFNEALKFAPAERPAFLAGACGSDAALRRQLEELLKAEAEAGGFLPEAPQQRATIKLDHAAAALPDLLQQLVAPQSLAHGFIGRIGEVEFDGGFDGARCRGQRVLRLVVGGEQRFKALAEGAVCSANGLKKC